MKTDVARIGYDRVLREMFIRVMGEHDAGVHLEPCVKPLSADFSAAGLLRTFKTPSYREISERVIWYTKLISP